MSVRPRGGSRECATAAGEVSGERPVASSGDFAQETRGSSVGREVGSRSVRRALAVLELLARSGRPLSLSEIAGELRLAKSSARELLLALSDRRFACLDASGRYRLGVRCFEVGAAYARAMTPVRASERELEQLTRCLGVTSHFAVLDGSEVVYLLKHDPPGSGPKLASSLGGRLPAATTAVGKAQLAERADDRVATGAAGLDGGLSGELAEVRRRGYAVDEGETAVGIRCVAAPVFDAAGCCGALGVSCLIQGGPDVETLERAVRAAAERASARLGGRIRGPA